VASSGEVGSGCAECAMGRSGKARVPPEPTDGDNSLSMLGNSKVRGVYFAEMNLVARFHKRFEQVENELAPPRGKKALHILEDERARTVPGDEICIDLDERVSLVVRLTPSGRREALTGRPARNHVSVGKRGRVINGFRGDVIA